MDMLKGGRGTRYGAMVAAAALTIGSATYALAQAGSTDIKGIV
ncbi:hypothetical protein [Sphingomonas sp. 22R3R2A-7]